MTELRESAKHSPMVVSFLSAGGWRAECSCGWRGPRHPDISQAARDCDEHRADVKPSGAER